MTLQECKDQIARENGFSNWADLLKHQFTHLISRDQDEAAVLYAQGKVKEALRLASKKAETTTIANPNYQGQHTSSSCDCNRVIDVVDKQCILSFETELLTKIEKEI